MHRRTTSAGSTKRLGVFGRRMPARGLRRTTAIRATTWPGEVRGTSIPRTSPCPLGCGTASWTGWCRCHTATGSPSGSLGPNWSSARAKATGPRSSATGTTCSQPWSAVSVLLGQVFEVQRAGLRDAFLGFVVDSDDAEAFGVAVGPFEVVHQGPGEVAADVCALGDGVGDRGEMGGEVGRAVDVVDVPGLVGVVVEGGAVLGDDHREAGVVAGDADQQLGEAFGDDLPVHRGAWLAERYVAADREAVGIDGAAVLGVPGELLAEVVVDPEHVDRSGDDLEVAIDHRQLDTLGHQVRDDVGRVPAVYERVEVDPPAHPV